MACFTRMCTATALRRGVGVFCGMTRRDEIFYLEFIPSGLHNSSINCVYIRFQYMFLGEGISP